MKIGFVLDDTLDKPDGVQQYVLTLGKWLSEQGHNLHYLVGQTARDDLLNIHSMSKNIKVRFNKNRMSVPLPTSKHNIKKMLDREQFDVLHVQMPYSPLFGAQIVNQASSSTAVVGTFHIAPFSQFETTASKGLARWLKKSLARFDTVMSVSDAAQTFASEAFHLESVVIPNMVNLRHFREPAKAKVALNHPNIVFLGRLEPRKGCMELLKAIAKLKKTHGFESTFYICGAGSDQAKLQAFARQHKLTDDVKFVGFVSEIKKLAYLQAADIAVFPSLGGESFGIVLLEAMAASKGIVIGGDNPGYRAVLGTLPGALTNPKNTTEFADKLHELLGNQRLRSSLHKAQSKLVEQYDVAKVGPEIMSVYRHAIAKRSVQGHN